MSAEEDVLEVSRLLEGLVLVGLVAQIVEAEPLQLVGQPARRRARARALRVELFEPPSCRSCSRFLV